MADTPRIRSRPVFYFGQDSDIWDFYLASSADNSVIDKLGRIVLFSAARFRRAWSKREYDLEITIENAPSAISEGRLLFGADSSGGVKFDVTGPEKITFEAGQFIE